MKRPSSCILNSRAILDAVRSRESEILFKFRSGGRCGQVGDTMVYLGIEDSVTENQQESFQACPGNLRLPLPTNCS
jgi:hypothetical protein